MEIKIDQVPREFGEDLRDKLQEYLELTSGPFPGKRYTEAALIAHWSPALAELAAELIGFIDQLIAARARAQQADLIRPDAERGITNKPVDLASELERAGLQGDQ